MCVFGLSDASVTGAELIAADGWRRVKTYILQSGDAGLGQQAEGGDREGGSHRHPTNTPTPLTDRQRRGENREIERERERERESERETHRSSERVTED